MARAWSLITLASGTRQYGGNLGHEDEVEQIYRYDSHVANHTQVSEGDVVFLRDRKRLLGVARIEAISSEVGEKARQRCPQCNGTFIRARTTVSPPWRCSHCHAVFSTPKVEMVSAKKYVARYGKSFISLGKITAEDLKAAAYRPNDQHSIEELDVAKLLVHLKDVPAPVSQLLNVFRASKTLGPDEANEPNTGFEPSTNDTRASVLREIRQRRGQRKFRDALRARYGDQCVVSQCPIVDILEAAHINPYRNESDNHPENGLLLRSDLHTLFDLFKMGIEPGSLKVHFHQNVLADPTYATLEGVSLKTIDQQPSKVALELHWAKFVAFR